MARRWGSTGGQRVVLSAVSGPFLLALVICSLAARVIAQGGFSLATGLSFPRTNEDLVATNAFRLRYGSVKPPQTMDWRAAGVMSPPANQNPCGACWSYAVAHGVEAYLNIGRVQAGGRAVRLAEMQPVACSTEVSGDTSQPRCKDGWVGKAYRYAAQYGFAPQELWAKWTGGAYVEAQTCPAQVLSNSAAFSDVADTITGWETAAATSMALKKVVANQPAVVLVHASADWQAYRGGLFAGNCSSDIADANHAVLVVGWTDDAWIVKNSWGADWGEGGYMRLPQDPQSVCGILNQITYPVFDPVRADRQGEVLRQGFCSGIGRVELPAAAGSAGGAAPATLRTLSAQLNVSLDNLMRVNGHIQGGPDAAIEPLTKYFIPPCSRDVPPPPVPKASCGTTYSIFAAAEPASAAGSTGSGRRRRALAAAARLGGGDGDGDVVYYAIQDGFQLHPHGAEAQRRHLREQRQQREEALAQVMERLQFKSTAAAVASARHSRRSLQQSDDSCPWTDSRNPFGGSYSGSCYSCSVSASTCTLSCTCRGSYGYSYSTSLALNTCASGAADNINGRLVCSKVVAASPPPPSPSPAVAIDCPWTDSRNPFGGSYSGSCYSCSVSASTCTLSCTCRGSYGYSYSTSLALKTCASGAADNSNGQLVCRPAASPPPAAAADCPWTDNRNPFGGSYSGSCYSCSVSASTCTLSCTCRGSYGYSYSTSLALNTCASGAADNINGQLVCSKVVAASPPPPSPSPPRPPLPAPPPSPAAAIDCPWTDSRNPFGGSYSGSCYSCSVSASACTLSCTCRGSYGYSYSTSLALNTCASGAADNINGQLVCSKVVAASPPPPSPSPAVAIDCPWTDSRNPFGGSYSGSCYSCSVSASTCTLSCTCRGSYGYSYSTSLALKTCASGAADNSNGQLVCSKVVAASPPPPSPSPAAAAGGSSTASPSPSPSPIPSPAANKYPPIDCAMPSSWCRDPANYTLVMADCDSDGATDWACATLDGSQKGVLLSSKGCSSHPLNTGWPDAPVSACPSVFGRTPPPPPPPAPPAPRPPPTPPPTPQPPPFPPPNPSPPSGTEGLSLRFPLDYGTLVANITSHRYPHPGADATVQPTQLLLLGAAFPVLLSPDGKPLVAAATFGAGRVVVVGESSIVSDIQSSGWAWTVAPSFRLINNALGWLAGLGRPLARRDALNEVAIWGSGLGSNQAAGLQEYLRSNGYDPKNTTPSLTAVWRRYDAVARPDAAGPLSYERLSGYKVLIMTSSELLSPAFTADLHRYVREGGSLLLLKTSTVKPFPSVRANVTFANVYSCNRLLGPMGLLITGAQVEPVPSWRPDVPVPAAPTPDMLLANAEYAAELLGKHWGGRARGASRLSVETFEAAVASMEFAKTLLTPSRALFPSFFNLLASLRGPSPPPALTAASGSSTAGDGSSTRLGPLYTYWLTSPALEIIEEKLEEWNAGCPEGTIVTGFEGMAWSTRDARPWGATRGGMFTTELRLQCSDRSVVDTGYATAPEKYATATLPMMEAGIMDWADTDIPMNAMFGVRWMEPACAGGYDAVRARAHSGDESNYVAPIQLFFRCRDNGHWTTYTAGIGLVTVKLDPQEARSMFRSLIPGWYINGRQPLPYRSAVALQQLQAMAQLEDTAAVYCPPGQVVSGLTGLRWVPPVSDYSDAVSGDPYLYPDLRTISWFPGLGQTWGYQAIQNTDIRMNPGYTVMLSVNDVICRPAPAARDYTDAAANHAPATPTQIERAVAAAPYDSTYMLTVAAPPPAASAAEAGGGAADTSAAAENATLLTCGEGSLITAVMAASDSALDLNYVAVRCIDGRSVSVGTYSPKNQDASSFVDNPCLLGYDAVRTIGGRVLGGSGSGLGGFAVRCASPIKADSSSATSPWTRFGGPVLSRVGPWADNFALTEASINAPVVECPERQRVSALRVVTVKGMVTAVSFYCAPLPPPPKDYSFLDIAARYGITLSDLFNANPQLDRALPVVAYNGSVIAIPQLCGLPPLQPPVSTIASGCPRYWPFPNTTNADGMTCGALSQFLKLPITHLNTINDNPCPSAATTIARGTRMCVAPPAAISSAAGHHHRRRGLLQSSADDASCAESYTVADGDFCESIASAAGVEVGDLLDWNSDLDCAKLQVATVLCVRKGLPRAELLARTLAPPSPPSPPSPPPQPPSPPPRPPALPASRWVAQTAAAAASSPVPRLASPPPSPKPPSPRSRPPRPPVLNSPSPPRRSPPPPSLPRPPTPPPPPSPPSPPRLPNFPPRAPRRTYVAVAACNATVCGPEPNRCLPSTTYPAGYYCNCSSGYVASEDGATCLPLLNVALRRPVFASSTMPADPEIQFDAQWAVDGNLTATLPNTAGYFSSARGDTMPFLSIDLGSPYELSHVVIATRPGYGWRLSGAVVRVGFAAVRGEQDRAALMAGSNPACWQQGSAAVVGDRVEARCAASGQWVTVVNTGGALLQLAEVQVYVIRQLASCPKGTVPAVGTGGCSALAPPPPPSPPSPRRAPPSPRPPAAAPPPPRLGNGTCSSNPCGPSPNTCQSLSGGAYSCTCGAGYALSGASPLTCASLTANIAAGRWIDWYTSSRQAVETYSETDLYDCIAPGYQYFSLRYEDLTDGEADPNARTKMYVPGEDDRNAPWVSMDLGKPYLVRRVVLSVAGRDLRCLTLFVKTYEDINKTFGGFALMKNTVFRVGNVPVMWGDRSNFNQLDARGLTRNPVCYIQSEAVAAGSKLVATCDPPLVGQYVSVQQNTFVGNELIALTEFEVYGTPAAQCPAGYTAGGSDGSSCVDVDECVELTEPCGRFPNTCINLPGNYTCSCSADSVLFQNTTGPTCVPRGIVPWRNADIVFDVFGRIGGYKDSVVFASSAYTLPVEEPFVNDGRGRDYAYGPFLAFNGISSGTEWTTASPNINRNYFSNFQWSEWIYTNGPFFDAWRSADGDRKPWISIFLTGTYVVSSVTLYNVPAATNMSDYLVNVEVRVGGVGVGSLDASALIPENELCGTVTVAADAGEAVTVLCKRPLVGRWVSVQKVAPAVRTADSSPAFDASLANTLVLSEVEVRGVLAPRCPLGQIHDPTAVSATVAAGAGGGGGRNCVPAKPRPVRFLDVRSYERAGGGHAFLRTNDNVYTGYAQDSTWRDRYDYASGITPYYPVAVCADGWNNVAAAAFCRALGKAGGTASSLDKPNSWSSAGSIWYGINNVTCASASTAFGDCTMVPVDPRDCVTFAGVTCT